MNHPIRDLLVKKLTSETVAKGGDPHKVEQAVQGMLEEKSILEWLLSVDWVQLIELVLKLAALL